jgi:hypothetical protein
VLDPTPSSAGHSASREEPTAPLPGPADIPSTGHTMCAKLNAVFNSYSSIGRPQSKEIPEFAEGIQ